MSSAKSGSRGWWIGCGIAAAVMIATGGACAALVFWGGLELWRSPEMREAARVTRGAVAGSIELMREASSAPGTAELRDLGCNPAWVFTPEAFTHLFRSLELDAEIPEAPEYRLVMCIAPPARQLSCETLARTYATAIVNPPEQFMLSLETERGRGTQCEGLYDREGHLVRELEPDERESYGRIPH